MATVARWKGESLRLGLARPARRGVPRLHPVLRELQRGLPRRAAHHLGRRRDGLRAAADPEQAAGLGVPRPAAEARASSGARWSRSPGSSCCSSTSFTSMPASAAPDRRRDRADARRHARRFGRQRRSGAAGDPPFPLFALLAWSMAAGAAIDAAIAFAMTGPPMIDTRPAYWARAALPRACRLGADLQPLLSGGPARSGPARRPIRA